MTGTTIACKQQTLATDGMADRVCCLRTSAVPPRRTSEFTDARGDKSAVRSCGYLYRTLARDYVNNATLQPGGEVCSLRCYAAFLAMFAMPRDGTYFGHLAGSVTAMMDRRRRRDSGRLQTDTRRRASSDTRSSFAIGDLLKTPHINQLPLIRYEARTGRFTGAAVL